MSPHLPPSPTPVYSPGSLACPRRYSKPPTVGAQVASCHSCCLSVFFGSRHLACLPRLKPGVTPEFSVVPLVLLRPAPEALCSPALWRCHHHRPRQPHEFHPPGLQSQQRHCRRCSEVRCPPRRAAIALRGPPGISSPFVCQGNPCDCHWALSTMSGGGFFEHLCAPPDLGPGQQLSRCRWTQQLLCDCLSDTFACQQERLTLLLVSWDPHLQFCSGRGDLLFVSPSRC